jgi:hypothetical protein
MVRELQIWMMEHIGGTPAQAASQPAVQAQRDGQSKALTIGGVEYAKLRQ